MILVLVLLVAGGIIGYQIDKPCDKACFQRKIDEAREQVTREDKERKR